MVKSIIKRVIVGIGVALGIMAIKGSLIANVSALEVVTFSTPNNTNFASCTSCGVINSDWNFSSGLTNVSGIINGNVLVYNTAVTNGEFLTTLTLMRIRIDGVDYPCTFNAYGSPYTINNSGGQQKIVSIYSIQCPVRFGNNGNFQHIYIQTNGGSGNNGISFYSPISFTYDNGNEEIINSINDNTSAVEETNDTLKDDSVDNDKAEGDIDDMKDKVASNGTITQLLTLPIQLYQKILNSLNGSCSSINLGSLFNHNLTLTCINLQNILGSTLYNIIDILCCGLFILAFRKKMVDIFNHMTSLNDRGNELE